MLSARVASWVIAVVFVVLAAAMVAMWDDAQETTASGSASTGDCTTGIAVPDPANNPGLVSDCGVLLLSLDALSASSTLNWSVDVRIDDWEGVRVGGIPLRVVELSLLHKGLTGEIPPELGMLAKLEYLELGANELTGEIPPDLGDLSNLKGLDLHGSHLSGAIPAELGNLADLESLYLSSGQLTGPIPPELGSLSNLKFLDLSENRLTGEIPSVLARLANLETLELFGNRLDGSIPAELGSLSNLRNLELDGNELTGRITSELGNLPNLDVLNLRGNFLSGGIPVHLSKLARLNGLYLSDNQLTGEIPAELGSLTGLRELYLRDNQLTGSVPASLASLSDLTHMFLNRNQLTGCIPDGLLDVMSSDVSFLRLPFCTQPATSLGVGSPGAQVRIDSPTPVTAWFSKPVSGFAVDDIVVTNGSASNLAGVAGGMVYTFDVTPDAIGPVTVNIAADMAVDAEVRGNTAAEQLLLGMAYDDDDNGAISRDEVITGISDYLFSGLLTRGQVIDLIGLYLFGPTATFPDLVVDTPTVSDSSPRPGKTIALRATIRNQGTSPSDTVTLRYYRSTDPTITGSDAQEDAESLQGIDESTSTTDEITVIAPLTPGTYYYGACVDTVYRESDTTNNCSIGVAVTVVEPAAPVPRPAIGPIPGAKTGGTIKYVPQGSIRIIDPMATWAIVTGTVGRHVYDQLFWRDSNYHIYPQMLESWGMSSDGKQYTFRVRPDQKFHNGDPLRMVDIAESHNRFARVDRLGWELLGISAGNVDRDRSTQVFNHILDETNNTIVMKFEEPTAVVLEFLAAVDPRQPSVMHEDVWSIDAGQPVNEAIGTGAFMMTEWRQGELLEFERHPDYVPNTGEPWDFTKGEITQYLDGFVALEVPSHTTRIAALQADLVDVLDDFRLDQALTLDGHPDVVWSPVRDGRYGIHEFNFHHPPFDMTEAGRLARRAVYAASPNDKIMQAAVGDSRFWKECYMEIHCGTPWTTVVADEVQAEGIKTYSGNLELGRQILEEAEALDSMIKDYPVRLVAASDFLFMREAGPVMAQTLTDMGFTNVELILVDWATRISITRSPGRAWEMAPTWSNFSNGLHPLAPSMPSSNPEGSGRWVEPRMTMLREQFLNETDPVKLQELFDEMNRVLYDNPARVWHFMFSPARAIRSDVKNFCLDCLFPIMHNVWLDR